MWIFSAGKKLGSVSLCLKCWENPIIKSLLQGAAGKYQIAQEKTQMELDKAHQEIDILREKMERNTGESRRVSFCY